ncbi:MAG: Ig-like domain-containing protein, partial [Clostridia bacterium]|nr:Ig-like domain-containing protein [Clostridia bacterium]
MKAKRRKIFIGALSAFVVAAASVAVGVSGVRTSAETVEFATDSTKWQTLTGITVDSTYGLVPSVLSTNKSVMTATGVNLESDSSGTITSDFSGGSYGVMAYYLKWNEGTDAVSWDWSTGATSAGTNEFFTDNNSTEKITATGVKGDWAAVVISYAKAPMVLECNGGTITQIGSLWTSGFGMSDYQYFFKQETQISYSVADTDTGVTYQFGFYTPDYGLKTQVGMNTTGGVQNSTNTRLQGAGAIRIEKIVAGAEFTSGNSDYLAGTENAIPASFIKVAVDGKVSTGGDEPPSTSVEYGTDSTKWQTLTSIGVGDTALVPTQTDGSSNFKATTVDVGGNSAATITSDFATSGNWGAMVYMFKWNEGLDAVTWSYNSSATEYDYNFDGVIATGATGNWLALIVKCAKNPVVVECKDGTITQFSSSIWQSGFGSADTSSLWKQKTTVNLALADTETGVTFTVSYDATQSDGTEIGVTETTINYTSTNTQLRGEGAFSVLKVCGNPAFDGTSANTVSVKVDDIASEYTAGADEEAEKHWSTTASYPTDFTDGSFTLVGIGDPQMFTKQSALYTGMYKWIADNKDAYNIQYAINLGDTVDYALDTNQWALAQSAHKQLQDVNLKYALVMGNHDYEGYWNLFDGEPMDRTATNFATYFPYSTYESWLGTENFGVFEEGKMENSWHKFTYGEDKYLIVSLEYGPKATVVQQAKELIDANPDYHVIVATHCYLDGNANYCNDGYIDLGHDGAVSSEQLWENLLSKCPNIFMTLCGHTVGYGVGTTVAYGDAGNPIIQMKVDAQGTFNDEETLIALYKIKGTSVETYYYSVSSDRYYAGSNFSLAPVQGSAGTDGGIVGVEIGASIEDMLGFESKDGTTPVGTYASTDTKVATVDENGKVTAVGVGTTTITYSLNGRQSAYATSGVITKYTVDLVVTCSHTEDTGNDHSCDTCGTKISECADEDKDHACDICGETLSECADEDKDHLCDICGETVSECADEDKDHLCDTCGETLSECADEDKDHKCDICGTEMGTHAGTETSHICEYCGEKASECADEDKNHACDICGETLSECADEDKNHACDICGETLSECADEDKNHACDICGETISECVDEGKDHKCDICGTEMGTHAGTATSHICEYCGEKASECVDEGKDHKCDICETEMGVHAGTETSHICEYCGEKASECVDEDKNHACDICGTTISECADADKNHACDTCGEKVSDCADEDKDHACDICGKTLSECADND